MRKPKLKIIFRIENCDKKKSSILTFLEPSTFFGFDVVDPLGSTWMDPLGFTPEPPASFVAPSVSI